MATKTSTKKDGGTVKSGAGVTNAEIDTFVAAHEKAGAKMKKSAIVDAIRASGAKIGVAGGDYLAALLKKRPADANGQKAAAPAEKPQAARKPSAAVKANPTGKAARKATTKASKSAEGNVGPKVISDLLNKPLTRTKVTPIPKAKDKAKAAKAS